MSGRVQKQNMVWPTYFDLACGPAVGTFVRDGSHHASACDGSLVHTPTVEALGHGLKKADTTPALTQAALAATFEAYSAASTARACLLQPGCGAIGGAHASFDDQPSKSFPMILTVDCNCNPDSAMAHSTCRPRAMPPRTPTASPSNKLNAVLRRRRSGRNQACALKPDRPGHASFARRMTCEMSLRLLNIPRAMHNSLELWRAYPLVHGRRSNKCTLPVYSPDGVRHPIAMVSSSGSHHRRLTDGWRRFCVHAGVRLGDVVHFYRTSNEPYALACRVDKACWG